MTHICRLMSFVIFSWQSPVHCWNQLETIVFSTHGGILCYQFHHRCFHFFSGCHMDALLSRSWRNFDTQDSTCVNAKQTESAEVTTDSLSANLDGKRDTTMTHIKHLFSISWIIQLKYLWHYFSWFFSGLSSSCLLCETYSLKSNCYWVLIGHLHVPLVKVTIHAHNLQPDSTC